MVYLLRFLGFSNGFLAQWGVIGNTTLEEVQHTLLLAYSSYYSIMCTDWASPYNSPYAVACASVEGKRTLTYFTVMFWNKYKRGFLYQTIGF